MLQTISDELGTEREVFVVDFDTMPALPITWSTEEEKPYAFALAHAIQDGVIKEPGKYGIGLDPPVDPSVTISYSVYTIKE